MSKKIFTATEVMMLIEDLKSDFRLVTESVVDIKERLVKLEKRVDDIFEQVGNLTITTSILNDRTKELAKDVKDIKADVAQIKNNPNNRSEVTRVEKLEKRIFILEKKMA